MRNMSFALTTAQIANRTKTVTRRLGWGYLKAGDLIQAVEKCQGLKAGEKVAPLAVLRITGVSRETLREMSAADVAREGFPEMDRPAFVEMFCRHNRPCEPYWKVTRIEFEYVEAAP